MLAFYEGSPKFFMVSYKDDKTLVDILFEPLREVCDSLKSGRKCPLVQDSSWVETTLLRALHEETSSRGFLQSLQASGIMEMGKSCFFRNLRSKRRCLVIQEIAKRVFDSLKKRLPDRLSGFEQLKGFDVYAGDGHFHSASTHEEPKEGKRHPVGHFYSLDLRTHQLSHLCVGDLSAKKPHDMPALESVGVEGLRQGAPKGRKVLYICDSAGISGEIWAKWSCRGVYFISRTKGNMNLPVLQEHCVKSARGLNIEFDHGSEVGNHPVRHIGFSCPDTGESIEFVTSLGKSFPAWLVVYLYLMRWDIEKVFDEVKNKLHERKSWGKSEACKLTQAQAICLLHNLMRLLEENSKSNGVVNQIENERRAKRLNRSLRPESVKRWRIENASQLTLKFIRWLRYRLQIKASWQVHLQSLRLIYQDF